MRGAKTCVIGCDDQNDAKNRHRRLLNWVILLSEPDDGRAKSGSTGVHL